MTSLVAYTSMREGSADLDERSFIAEESLRFAFCIYLSLAWSTESSIVSKSRV